MKQKFITSEISDGGMEGEYLVQLNFTMNTELAGANYSLEIANELGKTTYTFMLKLQNKPNTENVQISFTGMKLGEMSYVDIIFIAYPRPTLGQWRLGNTAIPIGQTDITNTFLSSQISEKNNMDEYGVKLYFLMDSNLSGKKGELDITNERGTTTYNFEVIISNETLGKK